MTFLSRFTPNLLLFIPVNKYGLWYTCVTWFWGQKYWVARVHPVKKRMWTPSTSVQARLHPCLEGPGERCLVVADTTYRSVARAWPYRIMSGDVEVATVRRRLSWEDAACNAVCMYMHMAVCMYNCIICILCMNMSMVLSVCIYVFDRYWMALLWAELYIIRNTIQCIYVCTYATTHVQWMGAYN